VAATSATPAARMMLRIVAGTTDPHLVEAARAYWSSLLEHTARVIQRDVAAGLDPIAAIELMLAPIHFRLLITQQPVTDEFLAAQVDRTIRLLSGHPRVG
jgi:hypothetical protein